MIKINAKQFLDGLAGVHTFAHTDKNRPNLTGVLFETIENKLILAATDTYALGICELGEFENENLRVFLDSTKVKNLIANVKLMKTKDLILTIDRERVRVSDTYDTDSILSFSVNTDQFPKYREALPTYGLDGQTGATDLGINPNHFAKIAKIPATDKNKTIFKASLISSNQAIRFERVDRYGEDQTAWSVYVMPSVIK
jgi:hypothetical protein